MMNRMTIVAVACSVIVATLSACSGPTKQGLEARSQAYDRINLVNAQIHYDQAVRAFEAGQFDKAMREIRSALDRYDQSSEFLILQGRIYLESHRLEEANRSLQQAIEIEPESAKANYFAGIVFQRWSDNQQAYEHYMRAFEHDATNVQYLLAAAESLIAIGDYDGAEEVIQPRQAYFEHNSALRQLLAHLALLRDDPVTAANNLAEARLLNPDDTMLIEELAWAKFAAGRYARSHDAVRELLARTKEPRLDLRLLEARCLTYLERHSEARALYLELSRMYPGEVDVWIELGALAWEIRDFQRVEISGRRTIALAPNRYEGYLLRALFATEQGDLDEARALVEQAARRAVKSALPHLLLGKTFEQAGQFDEALTAYGAALRIEPNSPIAQKSFDRLSEYMQVTSVPVN